MSDDKPEKGPSSFWAKLKRRKFIRAAIPFSVFAWLLIQVLANVFPQLGISESDKKHVIAPGGHFVTQVILVRERLDLFDEYLGHPSLIKRSSRTR